MDALRGMHYIEVDGMPVEEPDFMKFGLWLLAAQEEGRHRVGKDIANGIEVSTVFIGFNTCGDVKTPQVYETMLSWKGGWDVLIRYSSRAEAQLGHDAVVKLVQEGKLPHRHEKTDDSDG